MDKIIEKRKFFLINAAFFAVLFGCGYLFYKYLFGLTAPFIISFFIAVWLQKPLRWIDRKTENKYHTLFAIAIVAVLVVIFIIPISLLLSLICDAVIELIKYLLTEFKDLPDFLNALKGEILNTIKSAPQGIKTAVSNVATDFIDKINNKTLDTDIDSIANNLSGNLSTVYGKLKNIPSAIIGTIIGIISLILFTKDYNSVVGFIKLQLPESKKSLPGEIKQVFSNTVIKMVKAYSLIMLITFSELLCGFIILNIIGVMDNSYIVIIAFLIAAFDILPVAGSGGILIPWALISLVSGKYGQAVGLLAIYAVITVIRQYIEPKIVGNSLDIHPIVSLAGLFIGLKLFGVLGMFIVPVAIMIVKTFNDSGKIHLYNTKVSIR